jgi:hypothetical protein
MPFTVLHYEVYGLWVISLTDGDPHRLHREVLGILGVDVRPARAFVS